jgi:serine/threonine protein kinase
VAATPARAASAERADHGLDPGDCLDGKYRIERQLGQGGMGAVYQATHLGTTRTVAVKVIRPRYAQDPEFVARFRREAEAAGRLRHPNVVDVTDFGFAETPGGRVAYLVMEYLDGCTLAEVLAEEGRLPRDWVVDILGQACSAVDEAHRAGLIHRDLKPDNIWLEPNRRGGFTVKVLDFGLVKMGTSRADEPSLDRPPVSVPDAERGHAFDRGAAAAPAHGDAASPESPTLARPTPSGASAKSSADADELTRVGSLLGTPLYMSPEQCRGEALGPRSDIYSLGIIAYRMLTGETPFSGGTQELVRLHAHAAPPSIREKARIPRAMARVIMGALAKDPERRPETAAGFADALRAGSEGSGTLLRQAVVLYGERFPTFFRLSLLGHAPLVAAVVALFLVDGNPPWVKVGPDVMAWLGPALLFGMVAANFLAYDIVSAATVPIVVESIVAPLRRPRLRRAFAALGRRFWTFSLATLAVLGAVVGGTILLVLPGIVVLLAHTLYAAVAVMEGGSVRTVLRRARALARRSWPTVLVIAALQLALPILVWTASIRLSVTVKLGAGLWPQELGYGLASSGTSALYQLLNILVLPLASIMTALLYLKTRQAGGESLTDAAARFDALDAPRSRWQARMKSRSSASSHGLS